MGDGYHFLDIILLAMVAGFIALRLRSMLGRRTGHEAPRPPLPLGGNGERHELATDTVVPIKDRRTEDAAPPLLLGDAAAAGVARIRGVDPTFRPEDFVRGARAAYEMIVTAFAKGDTETLEPLLAKDVFDGFSHSIAARRAAGEQQETTLVALKKVEIARAELTGGIAELTVKFVADLTSATRDAEGKVIAGNPNAVDEVTDLWSFRRDTHSDDPNWLLSATSAGS